MTSYLSVKNLTKVYDDTNFFHKIRFGEYPFQNVNKSIAKKPAIHNISGLFISIFQRKR